MRLTVLGGCGAWPTAVQACSGHLVEYDGFRLLVDPDYATLPRLLRHATVTAVGAVPISHGHPDHCAGFDPLLRARPGDLGHQRRVDPARLERLPRLGRTGE
ncbi:hypothetical protein OHB14_16390 [Streptomyces sp. NBC_01613]|uniref:MBL fold metallo-hydrolase n=1 Tax=Streptomyces sp. NBC_01613 TaxID=2975896 RepID=UPI00386B09C2